MKFIFAIHKKFCPIRAVFVTVYNAVYAVNFAKIEKIFHFIFSHAITSVSNILLIELICDFPVCISYHIVLYHNL